MLDYKFQIGKQILKSLIFFFLILYYFEMNFACAEEDHLMIVSKKEYVFLKWMFQFKTLWSVNLVLFFNVKSEF